MGPFANAIATVASFFPGIVGYTARAVRSPVPDASAFIYDPASSIPGEFQAAMDKYFVKPEYPANNRLAQTWIEGNRYRLAGGALHASTDDWGEIATFRSYAAAKGALLQFAAQNPSEDFGLISDRDNLGPIGLYNMSDTLTLAWEPNLLCIAPGMTPDRPLYEMGGDSPWRALPDVYHLADTEALHIATVGSDSVMESLTIFLSERDSKEHNARIHALMASFVRKFQSGVRASVQRSLDKAGDDDETREKTGELAERAAGLFGSSETDLLQSEPAPSSLPAIATGARTFIRHTKGGLSTLYDLTLFCGFDSDSAWGMIDGPRKGIEMFFPTRDIHSGKKYVTGFAIGPHDAKPRLIPVVAWHIFDTWNLIKPQWHITIPVNSMFEATTKLNPE